MANGLGKRVGGGRRGLTVGTGDCLRAGRDVGCRDGPKWEPLTGHDARDALRVARPRVPVS